MNRKLQAGEAVDSMFHAMKQTARKIRMNDEEFLHIFIHSHMTKQILIHRPQTPLEALEIARTLEQVPLLDDNSEQFSLVTIRILNALV